MKLIRPAPVLHHILSSPGISSPNAPVIAGTTTTALHVASEIGRADAVRILLSDPRTNDTLRDAQGRTPLECSANQEIASIIEGERWCFGVRFDVDGQIREQLCSHNILLSWGLISLVLPMRPRRMQRW